MCHFSRHRYGTGGNARVTPSRDVDFMVGQSEVSDGFGPDRQKGKQTFALLNI